MNKFQKFGLGVALTSTAFVASATPGSIDITAATSALANAGTAVAAVGVAMVAAAAAGIAYRWVTAFLVK